MFASTTVILTTITVLIICFIIVKQNYESYKETILRLTTDLNSKDDEIEFLDSELDRALKSESQLKAIISCMASSHASLEKEINQPANAKSLRMVPENTKGI